MYIPKSEPRTPLLKPCPGKCTFPSQNQEHPYLDIEHLYIDSLVYIIFTDRVYTSTPVKMEDFSPQQNISQEFKVNFRLSVLNNILAV